MKQDSEVTFSFGKNWQKFTERYSPERLEEAKKSLLEFLELENLKGKTFLDIGCGSGLFSLAAFELGASRVFSFDIEKGAVDSCRFLREKAGSPENWTAVTGSLFDKEFLNSLGKFDVVYAWGVFHYTGGMWEALKNAAERVADNGTFYIAVYNKVEGRKGYRYWNQVKKRYNAAPNWKKRLMEGWHMFRTLVSQALVGNSPVKFIKGYRSKRGMDWVTDVRGWLGGYPYECATVEEIFTFIKKHYPEFNLKKIKTASYLNNNWYVFQNEVSKVEASVSE